MLCCHKFFSKTQKLERSQLSHYATNMESNITVLKESLKNKSLIRQLNHAGMLIHIARYNVDNAKAILSWSKKNNGVLSESDINKIEKHIAGCEAYEQAQPYINL